MIQIHLDATALSLEPEQLRAALTVVRDVFAGMQAPVATVTRVPQEKVMGPWETRYMQTPRPDGKLPQRMRAPANMKGCSREEIARHLLENGDGEETEGGEGYDGAPVLGVAEPGEIDLALFGGGNGEE